ncbi:MAG: acyl--CoA ligase [Williamsia herbipolensis]|nr:acyl--CoA ligase [Williamsia herbipolensis]
MVEVPAWHGSGTVRVYRHAVALPTLIREMEAANGDSPLTVGQGEEHTYAELGTRAHRLARGLAQQLAVGPGDHIGIVMANRADYIVALFAAVQLGAVAVLINSRGSVAEIRDAFDEVPCRVVLADGPRATILLEAGVNTQIVGAGSDPIPPGVTAIDTLLADSGQDLAPPAIDLDDPCLVLFTSGTSGRAKGVALSHRSVATVLFNMRLVADINIAVAANKYGIPVDDLRPLVPKMSALLIFPMFHVSGLAAFFVTLMNGGMVATMTRWSPTVAADLISDNGLTVMAGPPFVVDELLSLPDAAEKLSSVVNIAAGGQATPPEVSGKVATALPTAQRAAGWGMTEVGGSVSIASGDLLVEHPTATGPMSPTMDVRVTEDGVELPPGLPGELEIRGGQMMLGYIGRPEETAATIVDGWLRTGDIGMVDEHGMVHIVDRKKDIVIRAGENISCLEVEGAVSVSGLFTDVAAFGIPDARLGEAVVVAVTPRPGVTATAESVIAIARETLPEYKLPAVVIVRSEPMPRTATGKLLKRIVRTEFLAESASGEDS